jgi:ATP phosphoribosyltransferase regulatory subunit
LKAGAELFGATGPQADAEVIALMLEVLRVAGIDDPILVLGHMGIYQNLVAGLELPPAREAELFTAVQSKAEADIARLLEGSKQKPLMVRLPMLMGERDVLSEARACLVDAGDEVGRAIDQLENLADLVLAQSPDGVELRFDLAELTGYGYHNGPVFSAYQAELGRALARGGRYDGIGEAFGRARPATGFDVILNELVESGAFDPAIWVPWTENQEIRAEQHSQVRALRTQGEVMVSALRAEDECPTRCDRVLMKKGADWIVDPVSR